MIFKHILGTSMLGLAVFALCCALLPGNLWAETLYVKKSGVKMTRSASAKATTVKTLAKGTAVKVLEKSGRYYRVALSDNSSGWIYRFKLSKKKPKTRSQSGGVLAALGGRSNVSVHESGSGSSIRGLQPASQSYARKKRIGQSHIRALDRIKNFTVDANDLLRFKREGGTGEFSGDRL